MAKKAVTEVSKKKPTKKNKAKKKAAPKKARVADPKAKDYLASLQALKAGRKESRSDYGYFESALYGKVDEFIPTGSLEVDKMIGGGWPIGRITEVAAWEGVGKSTLLDQSIAQCQRVGGVATLIDSEQARDHAYTARLGVDTSTLIVGEADTIEEAYIVIDDLIAVQEAKRLDLKGQRPPPLLMIWDSLGGTPAKEELLGAPDDAHVSPASRLINLNFKRIIGKLLQNRIALVFSNHFYKTIGGMSTLVSYGGKGVRYYPSVRLWLRKKEWVKMGDEVVGHVVEAKLRKTRIGPPRAPVDICLVHNAGFDNSWSLFQWGLKNGIGGDYPDHRWIEKRGRYSYFVPPGGETITLERSFLGLGQLFSEHPELYQQMASAFMGAE